MRVQLLLVVVSAILAAVHAASVPPAPTSLTCSPKTAASLGSAISDAINQALLPNASNAITKSKSNPYWQFTVPTYCWDNVLGFGYHVMLLA